ncbi:MAG: hypothetical protein F6J93_06115 [Oscillatoria sp. SIO1A7]|nr:hypothetical protein [Oscillatoria sp. SIO1A7]
MLIANRQSVGAFYTIALRIKVRTVQISLLASNGKACADRMTALLLIAYCYI